MKGILTDLDGTLLHCDMKVFIPNYLKALQQEAVREGLVPKESTLIERILQGTQAVRENADRSRTNEQVFMDSFFQDEYFAERKEKMLAFFSRFYAEVFPTLRKYSQPFPFAGRLADAMFETGLPVILATAPVFPRAAIEARVAWAGLSGYPFVEKTSYEVVHSCKPQADYFAETASLAGLSPADCLMIGNDRRDDLLAVRTGMETYLLEEFVVDKGLETEKPTYHGKAEELIAFLRAGKK